MSLRKSTCATPQRLDAQRRNARQSTGPRSEAGKKRMRMNALQHGCDAAPENEAAVMRALGEDPEKFEALKRELAAACAPGDALSHQLVDDLARLYWRRHRIERMETGLMRRVLEALEERQRARRIEIAAATFASSCWAAIDIDVGCPDDRCVQLRLLLSLLGVMREQVRQGVFTPRQRSVLETYYEGAIGWRAGRIRDLVWLFSTRVEYAQKDEEELREFMRDYFAGGEAAVEPCRQELLTLLDQEIAGLEVTFQHEVEAQEKRDAIARDAGLAPEGKTWETLLREEMALDRSIDRKVKILLTLRKEQARAAREAASPPEEEPGDRAAEELSKVVGLDPVEVAPNFSSAGAGLKARATKSQSPAAENPRETSKSAEQSQNVIENKGQGQKVGRWRG